MRISEYRRICQKNHIKKENEYGLKLFLRFFSIYFSIFFIKLNIKPNHITIFSIFFGFISAYQFYSSNLINGSIILIISIILDFSDGEVSRYFKSESLEGEYLDLLLHWILHPIIFTSITLYLFNQDIFDNSILILGFSCVIGSILISLARTYAKYIIFWLNIKSLSKNSSTKKNVSFSKNKLYNFISKLLSFYDFPYIMIIVVFMSFLEHYTSFNSLYLMIYFLGTTFPLIIILFIYLNVNNKRLSRV